MIDRPWLAPLAVAMAAMMLGLAVPILFLPMLFITGMGCVVAAALGLKALRRDPYDLRALRDLDENERDGDPSEPELHKVDRILCVHCGDEYNIRLPACPRCGRSSL